MDQTTPPLRIVEGDFGHPQVVELLRYHVATARGATAHYSAHALDLDQLRIPAISFFAAWEGDTLLAIGAIKDLGDGHGELKSMRTLECARRRGAGSAMLRHLLDVARAKGMTRINLETGSWAYFEPARALYRRYGFAECAPFAHYGPDPNSVFMTLALDQ